MGKPYFGNSYGRFTRTSGDAQKAFGQKSSWIHLCGRFGFLVLAIVVLQSCGAGRKVQIRSAQTPATQQSKPQVSKPKKAQVLPEKKPTPALTNSQRAALYIETFAPVAREEMRQYRIPASITLAQGLLESGFGQGRLAVEANNHFGIKCHQSWTGKTITHDDDRKGECFRVYDNPRESYRDHSLFLKNRSRYAFLFKYSPQNYKAWARGLKKAGYATDPKYPEKLIQLIDRFDLTRFDAKGKVRKSSIETPTIDKNTKTITVQQGDTLYGLARKHGIEVEALMRKNRLKENAIYPGQVLILPQK